MISNLSRQDLAKLEAHLRVLYGPQRTPLLLRRFLYMMGRYGVGPSASSAPAIWDESDVVLITYADMLRKSGESPLATLRRFCAERLKQEIPIVHLLPFYPATSDGGFAVSDYRSVDAAVGTWADVGALGAEFDLMFDLVLNHCSSQSEWFLDFQAGIDPAARYFVTGDPQGDWQNVVRPRTSPLFTLFPTRDGPVPVWTTFSADQVDLNWQNPDVLFEFLDILFGYLGRGVRILRLDAVAFLWKQEGTTCLHLPHTHEVVKLLRTVLEIVAPQVVLLTETNVPHEENISYFGTGDEAHLVYNFSLPPLLLHALWRGDSSHLSQWAAGLPDLPEGQAFLNFTASHDGIGVRPLQGILPPEEVSALLQMVRQKGGEISSRTMPDGTTSPYELNITYGSALADADDPAVGEARFLCSQAVALTMRGIPAVYFHSLLASHNHLAGVESSGEKRAINRQKFEEQELSALLQDVDSRASRVLQSYRSLLRKRKAHPAFHPQARQKIHAIDPRLFVVEREALNGVELIIGLFNFTAQAVALDPFTRIPALNDIELCLDLISGKNCRRGKKEMVLRPYQACWLLAK